MTVNIQITNDSPYITMTTTADYYGFVKVTNHTGSTITNLRVTPQNDDGDSYGFSYTAPSFPVYASSNSGVPSGTLYVPVDSTFQRLQIDFDDIADGPYTASFKAHAGAPRIKGTSSDSIDTWSNARCSGTVTVRNNGPDTTSTVYARLGTEGTGEPVRQGDSLPFEDVPIDQDELQVALDEDMTTGLTPINIIHQDGDTVTVNDPSSPGSDFEVDTQVLSADTNGQSATLNVDYRGDEQIEVTAVTFDGTETAVGILEVANASLSVPVDSTTAYLRIGAPPNSPATASVHQRPPTTADADADDDGLPDFIPLGGDPVVLVKHIGYTTGGGS